MRALGVILSGDAISELGARGERVRDDTLLILLNAQDTGVPFALPARPGCTWELVLDTAGGPLRSGSLPASSAYDLGARSLSVLKLVTTPAQSA